MLFYILIVGGNYTYFSIAYSIHGKWYTLGAKFEDVLYTILPLINIFSLIRLVFSGSPFEHKLDNRYIKNNREGTIYDSFFGLKNNHL